MPTNLTKLEKILKHLVSFRSISSDKIENKKLLKWVESELMSLGMSVTLHESEGHTSLVAVSQSNQTPKLWLVGHVDVVPAADDMFTIELLEEKIIGRGVFDDKIAAASFLVAASEVKEKIDAYSFGIVLTSDEEIGSVNGMKYLADTMSFTSSVAFVPDSGENWSIETRAKGAMHIKVSVKGRAAHGSMPWEGRNAIDILMKFLSSMRNDLSIPSQELAKDTFCKTMNVGLIKGGEATNQVPHSAEAFVDIRYINSDEAREIRKYIQQINDKNNDITVSEMMHASPVNVKEDDPWILIYKDLLEEQGIVPKMSMSNGSTDARFLSALGITTIVSMPPGGKLHAEGEWIDRYGANLLPKIVKQLIEKTI